MSLLLRSLTRQLIPCSTFFFFNDTATTEIYTLSLHDALPISNGDASVSSASQVTAPPPGIAVAPNVQVAPAGTVGARSEEHTSELQSQSNLVCRLLLEKKKKQENKQDVLAIQQDERDEIDT